MNKKRTPESYIAKESPFDRDITKAEFEDYEKYFNRQKFVNPEKVKTFLEIYQNDISDRDTLLEDLSGLTERQFDIIAENFRPCDIKALRWELIIKGTSYYTRVMLKAYPYMDRLLKIYPRWISIMLSWSMVLCMSLAVYTVFFLNLNIFLGLFLGLLGGGCIYILWNMFGVDCVLNIKDKLRAANSLRMWDIYEELVVINLRITQQSLLWSLQEKEDDELKKEVFGVVGTLRKLCQRMEDREYIKTVYADADDED